jgi:cytochrome c oxidase subunit 1
MLIAVPTGVKVFNWSATMWKGSLSFEPPMLFAIAFLFLFTIGGFSGLMLSIVPADFQYQDSYFVVAHFHYVLVPGAIFAIMAGIYYWLPKWSGHMYSMSLAKWHFWLSTIFVNVLFFPQHFLGLAGMPRRIPDYSVQFADWNMVSSIGATAMPSRAKTCMSNLMLCPILRTLGSSSSGLRSLMASFNSSAVPTVSPSG